MNRFFQRILQKKHRGRNSVNTCQKMIALNLFVFSFVLLTSSNFQLVFSQPLKSQELKSANSISQSIYLSEQAHNFKNFSYKCIKKQSLKISNAETAEFFTPIPQSSSNDFQNSESFLANYSGRPDQPIDWSEGEELRENEDYEDSSQEFKNLYRSRAGPESFIILPQFLTENISKAVLLDILHPFLRNTPPPLFS